MKHLWKIIGSIIFVTIFISFKIRCKGISLYKRRLCDAKILNQPSNSTRARVQAKMHVTKWMNLFTRLLPEWHVCGILRHQQVVGLLRHHVEIHYLQNISHVQSAGVRLGLDRHKGNVCVCGLLHMIQSNRRRWLVSSYHHRCKIWSSSVRV